MGRKRVRERLSTGDLPPAGRTAAWSALYAQRMCRVGFTPEDQSQFDAELRIGKLGPVKLANRGLGLDGVSRFAKWRSLAELELLDLVTVERRPRKSPLVTLRNL